MIRTKTGETFTDTRPPADRSPVPEDMMAAFQQANMFDCTSLLARITAFQCSKNQQHGLFVCRKCAHKGNIEASTAKGWKHPEFKVKPQGIDPISGIKIEANKEVFGAHNQGKTKT